MIRIQGPKYPVDSRASGTSDPTFRTAERAIAVMRHGHSRGNGNTTKTLLLRSRQEQVEIGELLNEEDKEKLVTELRKVISVVNRRLY